MATIHRFQDLEIWQDSREIFRSILQVIKSTELNNDYTLKGQISGSSGSIMDNIAEGFGRGGRNEFIQFLSIAKASATELQSQVYRCEDCGYISAEECRQIVEDITVLISRISKFMAYLKRSLNAGTKFNNRN